MSGTDDRVLLGAGSQERLRLRAAQALGRVRDVVGAPAVSAGPYRLILDHTMAKGLAHEAFGHACETDVAGASILATDGRLRLGEQVARRPLSIVDESLAGDYAYQPVSANGLRRQRVEIIRDGALHSGLGDPFSARQAGSAVTGAERVDTFRSRPMPRMANIRLALSSYAPLDETPELLTPGDVRERLAQAGLLDGRARTLLAAGYHGGQVSPSLGDFVFQCTAIYDLTDGAAPRQPAVVSGKCLSALWSIVGALGDLVLDVPGHCVKGDQTVATSGGSHAFVVMEPHPEVTVGGA